MKAVCSVDEEWRMQLLTSHKIETLACSLSFEFFFPLAVALKMETEYIKSNAIGYQ